MKHSLKASLAAMALMAATPAFGQATAGLHNGPDLETQIKVSLSNPINDATVVYGTTVAGDDNVVFTGDTAIHITDGAGYASISDADGGADFFQLVVNPEELFQQYQFSIQFFEDAYFTIEYSLDTTVAGGGWMSPIPGFFQQGNDQLKDYQLEGNGLLFDAIRITSTTGGSVSTASEIHLVKQNSITTQSQTAVPEPSTWAMMLLGFGAIGFSVRRSRRKQGNALMAIA